MDKIKKISKKLLLFFLLVLCCTETGVIASLSEQLLVKKFDISNIKTLFLEKAKENKSLLFFLGTSCLLSCISWKVYQARKGIPQFEEPPKLEESPSQPLVLTDPVIKEYYEATVIALKKLIRTQSSEETMDQIFIKVAENHARYMQYDQGKLPDGLPEEIKWVMKLLLRDFDVSEKNINFQSENKGMGRSEFEISIDDTGYLIEINFDSIRLYNLPCKTYERIRYFFKFLAGFADCLGSITSKRLCFENEINGLHIPKNAQFSLNQHLAFLSHIASLFYSRTAADIKTAYQYLSFEPLSYEKLPMNEVHHLFSTELQSKLSLGTSFLSTFDYARYLEITGKVVDFSMFEHMGWLPKTIQSLLRSVPEKERSCSDINKFLDCLVFDDIYQSFDLRTGLMKKINRFPNFSLQPVDVDFEKNKQWLDDEINRLDQQFIDIYPTFTTVKSAATKLELEKFGGENRKTPEIWIDGQIPPYIRAIMKMIMQRHAKKYSYKNYSLIVKSVNLESASVDWGFCLAGLSWSDSRIKEWQISLHSKGIEILADNNITDSSRICSYFKLLKTFVHELGHLINRDSCVKRSHKDLSAEIAPLKEWNADQRLALHDRDIAEILFIHSVLNIYAHQSSEHTQSKIHPSPSARGLRFLDIAKYHNIISQDILKEERDFQLEDIKPIILKHGFFVNELETWLSFACKAATEFYKKHKNDQFYESLFDSHVTQETEGVLRITYPRQI